MLALIGILLLRACDTLHRVSYSVILGNSFLLLMFLFFFFFFFFFVSPFLLLLFFFYAYLPFFIYFTNLVRKFFNDKKKISQF